jgi:hypothetical protein
LNSDAGIALCSGAIVAVGTDLAMQNLARVVPWRNARPLNQ